jgi:hypothetical protein
MKLHFVYPALFAAIAILGATQAFAQTSCISINAIPISISAPGRYCLTSSLSTTQASGAAISVNAPDVWIDLQGFTLDGTPAGTAATTQAVFYSSSQPGFKISNGVIRGFNVALNAAVFPSNPNLVLIEDLHIDTSRQFALIVVADHSIVRRVRVTGVAPQGAMTVAIAIAGFGNRLRFIDNDIAGFAEGIGGVGAGISCTNCTGSIYEGNRITGGAGLGTARGLFVAASSVVRRNAINNTDEGVRFNGTGSKYQDNLTTSVTTPFIGTATDAGGNN